MADYFRRKMNYLKSTMLWMKIVKERKEKHEEILTHFEETYVYQDIDPKAEPVNIFIVDGGGMKGYAALTIMETINCYFLEREDELFDLFDFLGGTSIGGAISLVVSQNKGKGKTSEEVLVTGRALMDDACKVFKNISLLNLFRGRALANKKSILNLMQMDYDVPLQSDALLPAMACSAAVKVSGDIHMEHKVCDCEDIKKKDEVEPFIVRTYEYPMNSHTTKKPLARSTSDLRLYEAGAATSAAPVLFDRVRSIVDGKQRIFADGGIFQNCPLPLCLDEVSRLFPNRPIGVILNVGFSHFEEKYANRTIEIAKRVHPNLHFQRIAPKHITQSFSLAETKSKRIAAMEAAVKDWLLNIPSVNNATKITVAKLVASKSPSFNPRRAKKEENGIGGRIETKNIELPSFSQRTVSTVDSDDEVEDESDSDELSC